MRLSFPLVRFEHNPSRWTSRISLGREFSHNWLFSTQPLPMTGHRTNKHQHKANNVTNTCLAAVLLEQWQSAPSKQFNLHFNNNRLESKSPACCLSTAMYKSVQKAFAQNKAHVDFLSRKGFSPAVIFLRRQSLICSCSQWRTSLKENQNNDKSVPINCKQSNHVGDVIFPCAHV